MKVPVPPILQMYVQPTLVRLAYLYPKACFSVSVDQIDIVAPDEVPTEQIVRDVRYTLYREKVYAETLSMRRDLIEAVTRR
jgi:hypothetical protein